MALLTILAVALAACPAMPPGRAAEAVPAWKAELTPTFYAAPAFAPGEEAKSITERGGACRVAAYYPQTESETVNKKLAAFASQKVAAFKREWRYGSLDVQYKAYQYAGALYGVVFDVYAYNPERGLAHTRSAARFDLVGGGEVSEADVFDGEWRAVAAAFGVDNADSGAFVFDDQNAVFLRADGREVTIPLSKFGGLFTAARFVAGYYAQDEPSPEPSVKPAMAMGGPYIAITFDDGPHSVYTPRILDSLASYGAKATFFQLGHRMAALPDVVRRVVDEGHSVGNHSYNHKQLTKLSGKQIAAQIDDTNEIFFGITGQYPSLLRPPYGSVNKAVQSLAEARGMAVINWDIDPRDWDGRGVASIANHIIERAKDGDIILMHDIYKNTADAAEIVLKELTAKGFTFVTVGELIEMNGRLEAGRVYRSAKQ